MTGFEPPSIPFDHPFDPGAIPPVITPSIGLLSPSITPTSIPPYTPSGIEPRFGPWRPRLVRPLEGEKGKGWNRPRHRHERLASNQSAPADRPQTTDQACRASQGFVRRDRPHQVAASANTHQRTRQGLCGPCPNAPAVTACANTMPTRESTLRNNAALPGITHHRPHDGKSREGFQARFLSAPFTLLQYSQARVRHQASRLRRNMDWDAIAWVGGSKDPDGVGVGATRFARPIIDLDRLARGFPQNIFGLTESFDVRFLAALCARDSARLASAFSGRGGLSVPPAGKTHHRVPYCRGGRSEIVGG
jgi:hypothetical protein